MLIIQVLQTTEVGELLFVYLFDFYALQLMLTRFVTSPCTKFVNCKSNILIARQRRWTSTTAWQHKKCFYNIQVSCSQIEISQIKCNNNIKYKGCVAIHMCCDKYCIRSHESLKWLKAFRKLRNIQKRGHFFMQSSTQWKHPQASLRRTFNNMARYLLLVRVQ